MTINNEKYQKIYNEINVANSIAIFCHINPDGDTLASGLALYAFLKKMGKDARIFCEDNVSKKLEFLPYSNMVNAEKYEKADLSIAVDVSDEDRIGVKTVNKFKKSKRSVCIDHHKTNTNFAGVTLYEPQSATCEIVYKLLKFIDKSLIDDSIATLIITGMVTDSGAFNYNSTTKETHEIMAELYDYNVSVSDIIYRVIRSIPYNSFKLKSRVLNNAKFYFDNKVAIVTFTKEDFDLTNTTRENTEGIVSDLIAIDEVKIAIAVTEERKESYKISFRTKDPYDSSRIASWYGGGGHKFAAGCRIDGYYYDVIDKLLKSCKDEL